MRNLLVPPLLPTTCGFRSLPSFPSLCMQLQVDILTGYWFWSSLTASRAYAQYLPEM